MHFTQNPIGSADQLDLQDNAISFDYAMNSPAALWQDRFGKQHKTVQQALKDVGFKPAGFDFVSGGTLGIGDRDKCVFYPTDGYWYSWNGKLPYVVPANSSPTPAGSKGWKPSYLKSDIFKNIKDYGAVGDGVTDDSQCLQRVVDEGGVILIPKGVYILRTVKIAKSCIFFFEPGAVFKRDKLLDTRQSYWSETATMLDVVKDGLEITFFNPTFDGNKNNQPIVQIGYTGENKTTEPAGWIFRYSMSDFNSKDSKFSFINANFNNGTSGYILIKGANATGTSNVGLFIESSSFTDTIFGYGKGDPATPTALGFSSDYIQILDRVDVYTKNTSLTYSEIPTPVGRYAPVGMRLTYSGQDATNGGRPSLFSFGYLKISGLGRKDQNYNGTDFTTNNGIGAIDGYGNANIIFIEKLLAENNESISVRAKGSLSEFTVKSANIKNSFKGLQVSPATGVPCQTVVNVEDVSFSNSSLPILEFVGSNVNDKLRAANIGNVYQYGESENPTNLPINTNGIISLRNVSRAGLKNLYMVGGGASHGITSINVDTLFIDNPIIKKTLGYGLYHDGNGDVFINNPQGFDLNGGLVNIQNSGVESLLEINGGKSKNLKDYCVLNLNTKGVSLVSNHNTDQITGLGRGFYAAAGGKLRLLNNVIGDNVAKPQSSHQDALVHENGNSWNPSVLYGLITLTTTGSHKKGDIVYNSLPEIGQPIGWVCTISGAPGTWNSFGLIN